MKPGSDGEISVFSTFLNPTKVTAEPTRIHTMSLLSEDKDNSICPNSRKTD